MFKWPSDDQPRRTENVSPPEGKGTNVFKNEDSFTFSEIKELKERARKLVPEAVKVEILSAPVGDVPSLSHCGMKMARVAAYVEDKNGNLIAHIVQLCRWCECGQRSKYSKR